MNLSEDRRESQNVLSPRLLPALVLLKVWSESGEDPCGKVDLILLLLEAVCALEGSQDKVSSRPSLSTAPVEVWYTEAYICRALVCIRGRVGYVGCVWWLKMLWCAGCDSAESCGEVAGHGRCLTSHQVHQLVRPVPLASCIYQWVYTGGLCSVEESARSLTCFMDLFEKVLVHLFSHSADDDENSTPPLIPMFPLTPVLGINNTLAHI